MNTPACLAVIALVTTLVFGPGLAGGFIYDDFPNIVTNEALHIDALTPQSLGSAALAGHSGPMGRPLASASFALNHYFGGLNPFGYKLVNLVIHLLNAALVFWLARIVTARLAVTTGAGERVRYLPFALALLWAVHPINLSPVLYVVQRMTSLGSLFSLAAILVFLHCRLRLEAGGRPLALALAGCALTVAGALAKEIIALVPVYLAVLEWCVFRSPRDRRPVRFWINTFFTVTLLAPLLAIGAWLLLTLSSLNQWYEFRDFTLAERLMTQPRVLAFYVYELLLPLPGSFSLFQNGLRVSTGFLEPPATIVAILSWGAVAVIALRARARWPVLTLGVAWFLGGHLLESSVLPLEMVHEHRNYLPSFGVLFMLLWGLMALPAAGVSQALSRAMVATVIAVSILVTVFRVQEWRSPVALALAEVNRHPDFAVVQFEMGRIWFEVHRLADDPAYLDRAREHLTIAASQDPDYLLPVTGLIQLDLMNGTAPPAPLVESALYRAGEAPYHPSNVAGLGAIVKCISIGACLDDTGTVIALFASSIDNPTILPVHKALVLQLLSNYYLGVMGDYSAAKRVLAEVLETAPDNYNYRIAYVKMLIIGREWQEALAQIDIIKAGFARQAWLGRFKSMARLQRLEALAADVEAGMAGTPED